MKKLSALILAKSESKRLKNKNMLPFNGKPMFLTNVEKCLKLLDKVYVSSDSEDILDWADSRGAIAIKRGEELCGDVPNIPVYRHAVQFMGEIDGIVAVQANSPNIDIEVIKEVIDAMQDHEEVITVHPDGLIYGSVWALSLKRLSEYVDFYVPKPDFTVVDDSIDIHLVGDYIEALKQKK